MPSNFPQQESALRGPLHYAAFGGSAELVSALLATGLVADIDTRSDGIWTAVMVASQENHHRVVEILLQNGAGIDHRDEDGFTALSMAASSGHHHVVRILLKNGATVSSATNEGCTALFLSSQNRHLAVADMLVRAGAELDARSVYGYTALHMAATKGHLAVVRRLVERGAYPDTFLPRGEGPLFTAAFDGHFDVVKLLLSLGVNPARPVCHSLGGTRVPLDVAAEQGHRDIVRELLQLGIERCGGRSLGADAILSSARKGHVEIMVMLLDAGVVDTGSRALFTAIDHGREHVVKFLLQQEWATPDGTYFNSHDEFGTTPVNLATVVASPRIARMLLDAGADETKAPRWSIGPVRVGTFMPLELVVRNLADKKIRGKPATEDQLYRLESIRRLLLRVDAVRTASWLWSRNVPFVAGVDAEGKGKEAKKESTRLGVLIARRRTGVRRILLGSTFRYSSKP